MSDVAGAPAPSGDVGAAPAPVALGVPTLAEAASERLTALKADRAWGARYLSNDATARNEMKTLIALSAGNLSEADQTTLAGSIGLQRTPSFAVGDRQREAAQAATDALKPQYNYQLRSEFGSAGVASIDADLREWSSGLGLPATTERTVLQRVAESGTRVRAMTPEQIATWRESGRCSCCCRFRPSRRHRCCQGCLARCYGRDSVLR